MDKKIIYMVMDGIIGVIDFVPRCAFETEAEAQRYIINTNDDYDHMILKIKLYGSYLDFSIDAYGD